MSALEDSLREMVREIVRQEMPEGPSVPPSAMDEETRKQIAQLQIVAHKTYLNKKEIALYIGCSERSVDEWAARALNDNPLPAGYAGSEMRAKRENVDRWIESESNRKRLKLAR